MIVLNDTLHAVWCSLYKGKKTYKLLSLVCKKAFLVTNSGCKNN